MHEYNVRSVSPKDHKKQINVRDKAGRQLTVLVPRYAAVGPGDLLLIDSTHPSNIFAASQEDPSDPVRLSPHFERSGKATLGGYSFLTRITEVNASEDLESLAYLEQFHYKTSSFLTSEAEAEAPSPCRSKSLSIGGRRAILVLYLRIGNTWQAAGYIDLQMPLMMCKPRHQLFAHPFTHSRRPIHWATWDQHAIRKYVNLIVRIARVVVSPEYRGLGLARQLVQACQEYCRERWQIGGRRPIFVEISAEMLNYVDFVSSAGFFYVGKTEGNLERVIADLGNMAKGYEVTSGIMSLQKRYLTAIQRYCRETGKPFSEILSRLESVVAAPDPAAVLTPEEWAAFRPVLRMPIPYYLYPLDDDTKLYLTSHLAEHGTLRRPRQFKVVPLSVNLPRVMVRSKLVLNKTRNVRVIMDCFGLRGDVLTQELVSSVAINTSSGNIVMLVGPSGSGKSILLAALDPAVRSQSSGLEITIDGQRDYTAGWLKRLPDDIPLFDYFAEKYSPERAFAALSQTGLSEAFVFIKPFNLLSRGQQYRAMLADLLLREEQVWLLDEFCADLDPVTAKIVAHNFRRYVMATNRIAFVAAANHTHFYDALRPTYVIVLRTGGKATLMRQKDYRDEFLTEAV